ncbi:MAG: cupin domain-containing protein [Bacteroidales bacterium]
MIVRKEKMEILEVEKAAGGKGVITKMMILKPEEMLNKSRLCAKITLPPGSSIGEHLHQPDAEIYYILKGEATVTDNEVCTSLYPGDVLFTGNGNRHSIENRTLEKVEFLAIILD